MSNIYHEYKSFGNQPITKVNEDLESALSALKKDDKAMSAINYTWNVTKNLTAFTLSNWTHIKGSPWEISYVPGFSSIPINNIAISNYFKTFLESAKNAGKQPSTAAVS